MPNDRIEGVDLIKKGISLDFSDNRMGELDQTGVAGATAAAQIAALNISKNAITGNFAPVEETATASQQYLAGSRLVLKPTGQLYYVTIDIAQGGTIEPGVNVQATTMAGELAAEHTAMAGELAAEHTAMTAAVGTAKDAVNGNIAVIEPSSTASQAYSAGQFLVLKSTGLLYRVTQNISQTGTLTPGTNILPTTAGAELASLSSALTTATSWTNITSQLNFTYPSGWHSTRPAEVLKRNGIVYLNFPIGSDTGLNSGSRLSGLKVSGLITPHVTATIGASTTINGFIDCFCVFLITNETISIDNYSGKTVKEILIRLLIPANI